MLDSTTNLVKKQNNFVKYFFWFSLSLDPIFLGVLAFSLQNNLDLLSSDNFLFIFYILGFLIIFFGLWVFPSQYPILHPLSEDFIRCCIQLAVFIFSSLVFFIGFTSFPHSSDFEYIIFFLPSAISVWFIFKWHSVSKI